MFVAYLRTVPSFALNVEKDYGNVSQRGYTNKDLKPWSVEYKAEVITFRLRPSNKMY